MNTIIFSTHDIELAVELADSIYILGYPKDEKGQLIPTATLLKHFDLKQMGLSWHEGISGKHMECVQMIRDIMLES
jgi:polar amino acid transport system ATP-binding protein